MNNSRRQFLTAAAAVAGSAVVPKSLSAMETSNKYPVVHHVFFWLKNPGSKEDRDKLITGLKTLRRIEAIKELRIGIVAGTEKRDVVDNSWAVSELMFFEDLAGQASYQTHPVHQQFIKDCSHLWERVIVYDAIDV